MLSVLIVNWNTKDLLAACLDSLERYPGSEPHETIVVDNASSDGSAAMVRSKFPGVKLIESGGNLGYAKGNNLAITAASGEWLLTLNPDTEVESDTLDRAVEKISTSPEVGALGAQLIGTQGETQSSVRGFPTILGIFGDFTGLGRLFRNSNLDSYRRTGMDYTKEQEVDQPMGTFLLFRREALSSIGDPSHAFDESFPIFFNEVDLLYRLRAKGWKILYDPAVRVRHLGGASTRQVRPQMIWESHKSLMRYFGKHSVGVARLALPLLSLLVYAGAFVRARGYHAGFRA